MRILIVNDDGIDSKGLYALADALSENNEITVVAPDGNRSAFSHSLTINSDLFFKERKISDKFSSFTLSGTPADCVKFAVHYFKDKKFDLVCSGINIGNNLGSDTLYSGTVAAGIEGNYFGIPAIAFSNLEYDGLKFEENAKVIKNIFGDLLNYISSEYTLNVNIPNISSDRIKGLKFTKLGSLHYADYYEKSETGGYRLKGEPILREAAADEDIFWAYRDHVTVTPISYNRTNTEALSKMLKKENVG
ncbi:MAG: 5'/3'-nucleotidase SurE [Clostridia bacterium]|nr:5'/3'-nucleotidase SurE [Clostridia bacterium]